MISVNESIIVIGGIATFVLAGIALALTIMALTARALFASSVYCTLAAAVVSAVLLADGAALPAIALVSFGGGLLLVWVLGGMLLSTNAAKVTRRGPSWLTLLAMLSAVCLVVAVAPGRAAVQITSSVETVGLSALLAALIFVVGVSVIGLIGYGERGALERGRDRP